MAWERVVLLLYASEVAAAQEAHRAKRRCVEPPVKVLGLQGQMPPRVSSNTEYGHAQMQVASSRALATCPGSLSPTTSAPVGPRCIAHLQRYASKRLRKLGQVVLCSSLVARKRHEGAAQCLT